MTTTPLQFDYSDHLLIEQAKSGDKKALEVLVSRYQDYIFNVALAFVGGREDALDITQEVLIKIITHLGTFKNESHFKTWVYKIVKNHFLNMKRGKYELTTTSFEEYGKGLNTFPDEELSGHYFEIEKKTIVREAKLSCMRGMLLCLDREQRLIFILGELFEFPDTICGEIMEISKENFRVKLHRAKQQLYTFMDDKCGLVNKKNPCRCKRKTAGFIKAGCVDPVNLHFQRDKITSINEALEEKLDSFNNQITSEYQKLYQGMPFLKDSMSIESLGVFLSSDLVQKTFNLK